MKSTVRSAITSAIQSLLPFVLAVAAVFYIVQRATEVRTVLTFLEEGDPHACALGCIASQIMRPSESAYLNWNQNTPFQSFFYNEERNQIVEMQHPTYKAKPMLMRSNKTKITYRMLRKPMFSRWLSEQLLKYRAKHGDCHYGQVFPWKDGAALTKFFSRLRLQHGRSLPFLLDTCNNF